MRTSDMARAQRVPPRLDQLLLRNRQPDYADAFSVRLRDDDARSAEQLVRAVLEQQPRPVRAAVGLAYRHVLRLRLGPQSSPAHVLGWPVTASERDVVQLEARSPLLGRAVVVGLRTDAGEYTLSTALYFGGRLSRVAWGLAAPAHRLIAPRLLEFGAATGDQPAQ